VIGVPVAHIDDLPTAARMTRRLEELRASSRTSTGSAARPRVPAAHMDEVLTTERPVNTAHRFRSWARPLARSRERTGTALAKRRFRDLRVA
jgi:hypothetical protein